MKIYKAQGEQEIEAIEFEEKLIVLINGSDPTIFIGALIKHTASFFICHGVDKQEFIESCSEVYDRQVILYGKYLELLEREEEGK